MKFLQWFRRRCSNGENQSWLAVFVDGLEPFLGVHWGNNSGKFKKIRTCGLRGDVIKRKSLQTDGQMEGGRDGRTDGRRTVSVWAKKTIDTNYHLSKKFVLELRYKGSNQDF